jgi:hypothetical protein
MTMRAVMFGNGTGGAFGEAARPCSTTQIDTSLAPATVHRFLAGADAVPDDPAHHHSETPIPTAASFTTRDANASHPGSSREISS